MAYLKPSPEADEFSAPYWEGAAKGKLMLQKCQSCGTVQDFPRGICRGCHKNDLQWFDSSGTGTVYSFTNIYRAPTSEFAKDAPYTLAIVELSEGPHMMTNIVQCAPADVKIGMAVEVVFESISQKVGLPKFRPAGFQSRARSSREANK